MKKILATFTGLALLSFLPLTSLKAANYGAAGCGLGSVIWGSKPGFVQLLAATTNASFYSQLFGITTGTSNCEGGLLARAKEEQRMFARVNYDSLQQDIARGGGEKIENLAALMGCRTENVATFTSLTQKNYSFIFNGEVTPEVLVERVSAVAASDSQLANSCSYL